MEDKRKWLPYWDGADQAQITISFLVGYPNQPLILCIIRIIYIKDCDGVVLDLHLDS